MTIIAATVTVLAAIGSLAPIRVEEGALERTLGREHRDYASKRKRLLPIVLQAALPGDRRERVPRALRMSDAPVSSRDTRVVGEGGLVRLVVGRAARLVVVFFAATFGCFLLLSRLPGDICIAQLGFNAGLPGLLEKCRHAYGLDQSLLHQYVNWLGHMVRLDLGTDPISRRPMSVLIGMRLGRSLELVAVTLAISLGIGVLMGTVMGYREGSRLDRILSGLCMSFVSVPVFVTAVVLIIVFVAHLGWFPPAGLPPWRVDPVRHIRSLVLPVTTLVLLQLPVIARVVRADVITTLQADFVTAARAKGLSDARILVRHVLRPSSFTMITVAGLQAGELVSGLVIVERLFNLDGLGSMFYAAITARSSFLLMTLVTYMVVFWVVLNMVIDLLYAWLDPRIRRTAAT